MFAFDGIAIVELDPRVDDEARQDADIGHAEDKQHRDEVHVDSGVDCLIGYSAVLFREEMPW